MRRRRPARFASSAISRAERLTPAAFSSSSAARVASSTPPPASSAVFSRRLQGADALFPAIAASAQRSASARSARPGVREQGPRPIEVAGGEAGGGGDLVWHPLRRSELGLDRLGRERRELDRLAARGDRLQQRRRLGAEQDQVDELRRLLERLQQRVLALVAHRLRGLDDEDAAAALERAVGGGADHPLAHLLDHVLGAARRQPDEIGVGRGVEHRATAGVLGVIGRGGEDLGREGAGRGPLAGARRPAEQVGVGGA